MIHDLSGKEKLALLGAAEIALGIMHMEIIGREHPLSAEETADFAVGDPFGEHGLVAAGKKLCGMCGHKAAGKGVWECTEPRLFPCPNGAYSRSLDPCWVCPGFQKKPSTPRPPQPKKKGLPVPEGVGFLYFRRPVGLKTCHLGPYPADSHAHQGVVTVAWSTPAPGILHLGFSFCSPKDRWCKITGRDMALERLLYPEVVIPFLYSPKRTVHEVTRAMLTHDFGRIAALAPGVTMFGAVPSWTRGLMADIVKQGID